MRVARRFQSSTGLRLLVLLGLGVCALTLRLYGIDWDQGHFLHPDERFLLQFKLPELQFPWPPDLRLLLDPDRSPWNPRWFAYGSFPLYLLKLLSQVALTWDPGFTGDQVRFLGRGLSAVADVGTIFLVYLLGSKLYDGRTGLLAAAFTTFAVLHIQLSHFATVDALLTFWVLLTLYGAARVMEKGDLTGGIVVGVGLGLGLATKVSVLPLLVPVAVAYGIYSFFPENGPSAGNQLIGGRAARSRGPLGTASRGEPTGDRDALRARLTRSLPSLALAAGLGLALFSIAQPYALLDWDTFWRDTREQSEMVLRIRDLPFTRQYENTPPYLYHIHQLATWGLGWPLGAVAWLGLGFTVLRAWGRQGRGDLLLLAWVLPYLLVTGAFPVKFLRYLLPITPLLILMGCQMLFSWRDALSTGLEARAAHPGTPGFRARLAALFPRGLAAQLPVLAIGFTLLATVWYALAFTNIYRAPHPAVRLSAWINEQVPEGRLILKEHWEEGVPGLGRYKHGELGLYEPDDARKLNQLVIQLQSADYLIFYSNRLYGTIPRLPERYPISSRYYQLLFSGQLGYELVHSTSAHPSFLGVTWVDDTFSRPGLPTPEGAPPPPSGLVMDLGGADESFTVYDHPTTLLLKNTRGLDVAELRSLLAPALPTAGGSVTKPGLLLSKDEFNAQRAGGTWSDLFQRDSLENRFPLLTWLLTVEVLGLLAFPLAHRLFSGFPDRGWLFSKSLGILLVAYGAWLVASLQLLPFTRGTILLAATLLLDLGLLFSIRQWQGLRHTLTTRWRYILSIEVVFLAAFFGFYLVRLANPDLWHPWRGGEKPMDFAYLNAVIKSTFMPPYDPWFSGGYLNYYYFGQLIVGMLAKLSGIVPAVAYNLAVPTLFALLVGGMWSVGGALLASGEGWPRRSPPGVPLTNARRSSRARGSSAPTAQNEGPFWWLFGGGLTTAAFVGVVGNLDGGLQLLQGFQRASKLDFQSTIPGVTGIAQALVGLFQVVVQRAPPPYFDYWRSRAMGGMDPSFIDPILKAPSISITEFPFFTFLFADLHAHLIVLPFVGLALALAVQLAVKGWQHTFWGRIGFLAVFGLVLGAIRWINSWDYPTYLLLAGVGIFIVEVANRRLDGWLLVRVGMQSLVVLAFSWLFFLPFQSSYELFYAGGVLPSPETTPVGLYLRIHGLFLAALAGFLAYEVFQRFGSLGLFQVGAALWRQRYRLGHAWGLYRRLARRPDPPSTLVFIGAAMAIAIVTALALLGAATAGFLLALLGVIAVLFAAEVTQPSHRGPGYLLALGLAGTAALLSLTVEAVKLDIPGEVQRMNNVFKIYLQVWVLYAVSAAYGLWWVAGRRFFAPSRSGQPANRPRGITRLWLAAIVMLFCCALVYPALATPARVADRFTPLTPTDDGIQYMTQAVYQEERGAVELKWDREAILWLQENVRGAPVILEASTPIYRWGSRVSVYTGLPTVLGWDWHQTQQRWAYRDQIEVRKQDVITLYSTTDLPQTLALLNRYDIAYVYVGPLERLYYPDAGLGKFEEMSTQGLLCIVYRNPKVTIYAVAGQLSCGS